MHALMRQVCEGAHGRAGPEQVQAIALTQEDAARLQAAEGGDHTPGSIASQVKSVVDANARASDPAEMRAFVATRELAAALRSAEAQAGDGTTTAGSVSAQAQAAVEAGSKA